MAVTSEGYRLRVGALVAMVVMLWSAVVIFPSQDLLEPRNDGQVATQSANKSVDFAPKVSGTVAAQPFDSPEPIDREDSPSSTGSAASLQTPCYEIFDESTIGYLPDDLCGGSKRVVRESGLLCSDENCLRDYRVTTPVRLENPSYCVGDCVADIYEEPVVKGSPEARILGLEAQSRETNLPVQRIIIRRDMKPLQ